VASRTKVRHGAVVIFKYNGKPLTMGQNMEIVERTPLQSVDPVGTPYVTEHIRVSYEVDVTMTVYRAADATLKNLGLFPRTGRPLDILEHDEIIAEVYDQENDVVLERLTGFKIEEVSRGYTKGQLVMYNCRGKARVATDEAEN